MVSVRTEDLIFDLATDNLHVVTSGCNAKQELDFKGAFSLA
jgi:hypothetical protein